LLPVNEDLPLLVKHKGNTALGSHVAAALGEGVAHVGGGTVLVVRQGLHNDGRAAGAVALVCNRRVVDISRIAGGLLDAPVNGVVGHVVGLGLGNHVPQLAVVGR